MATGWVRALRAVDSSGVSGTGFNCVNSLSPGSWVDHHAASSASVANRGTSRQESTVLDCCLRVGMLFTSLAITPLSCIGCVARSYDANSSAPANCDEKSTRPALVDPIQP